MVIGLLDLTARQRGNKKKKKKHPDPAFNPRHPENMPCLVVLLFNIEISFVRLEYLFHRYKFKISV